MARILASDLLPLPDSIGAIIVGGRYSYITRQYTSPTTLPSQEPFAYLSPYGVANFSVDLLIGWLDPRVRAAQGGG